VAVRLALVLVVLAEHLLPLQSEIRITHTLRFQIRSLFQSILAHQQLFILRDSPVLAAVVAVETGFNPVVVAGPGVLVAQDSMSEHVTSSG
jgi:hypothetical protein